LVIPERLQDLQSALGAKQEGGRERLETLKSAVNWPCRISFPECRVREVTASRTSSRICRDLSKSGRKVSPPQGISPILFSEGVLAGKILQRAIGRNRG
jgi:hypothetical protein